MNVFHRKEIALPGPITTASVRPVLASDSISSTRVPSRHETVEVQLLTSLFNVTCISRQCLVLGQFDGGLLTGDPLW